MGNFRGQGVGVGCVMAALVVGAGTPAYAEPLVCLLPSGTLPTVPMPQFGRLGGSVAADGAWAVVGAPDDSTAAVNSGSFSIYHKQGGAWGTSQTFRLGVGSQFASVGSSVALDATSGLMIVTIPGIFSQSGLVWTLRLQGETWQQIASPVPPEFAVGAEFGSSVAIEGTYAVLGQRLLGTGRAYLFRFNGTVWDRLGTMELPAGSSAGEFGAAVAISGSTIVVGSPGGAGNFGGVHVFEVVNDAPTFVASLEMPAVDPVVDTGRRVAVSGDWIAVQSTRNFSEPGVVSLFRRSGGVWPFAQRLSNSDSASDIFDGFGTALDMRGDRLLIGMLGNEFTNGEPAQVFLYSLADGQWSRVASAVRPSPNSAFGVSVSLLADEVLVGASSAVVNNETRGAVYSFDLGSASIGQQPTDTLVNPGTSAVLSVALAPGAGGSVSYRWRRAGVDLVDGGRVTGSTTPTLTILNAQPGDLGAYDCVVGTVCGTLVSKPAAIAVAAPSSCNGDSNNDGSVTFVDITTVLANFGSSCP